MKPDATTTAVAKDQFRDPPATVLLVEDSGIVIKILQDDYELFIPQAPDHLQELVDPGSRAKLEGFLAALSNQQSALNWEINFQLKSEIVCLGMSGWAGDDRCLVLVTSEMADSQKILDQLKDAPELKGFPLDVILTAAARASSQESDSVTKLMEELTSMNNELVTLQREITSQKAELQFLNEQKDYFLGMAAHDLRNPLAAILSITEYMQDILGELSAEEQLELLGMVHSSSYYMLSLVEDLLDVSTIASGNLTLNKRLVPAGDVITRVIKINQVLARKKEIQLNYAAGLPAGVKISVDPDKFSQVLHNLISNAIKFTPPGSEVRVQTSATRTELLVSVADHGPGIPAEDLENLFQLYGKTSVVAPDGEKSTGLGLAIAKNIMDAHGGRIEVTSSPGTGTIFSAIIPGTLQP